MNKYFFISYAIFSHRFLYIKAVKINLLLGADVTLLDEIEIVLVLQFDFYYPYA